MLKSTIRIKIKSQSFIVQQPRAALNCAPYSWSKLNAIIKLTPSKESHHSFVQSIIFAPAVKGL